MAWNNVLFHAMMLAWQCCVVQCEQHSVNKPHDIFRAVGLLFGSELETELLSYCFLCIETCCSPLGLSACSPLGLSACSPLGLSACSPLSLSAFLKLWRHFESASKLNFPTRFPLFFLLWPHRWCRLGLAGSQFSDHAVASGARQHRPS